MSGPAVVMVAPNGARRLKSDHPALPVTIAETAASARASLAAGAQAIHCHVRDAAGGHVLDAGLYREAIAEITRLTGGQMAIQITTEAIGRYRPDEQAAVVRETMPDLVSVALREMALADDAEARAFYAFAAEAGIGVQHIVYEPGEVRAFSDCVARGIVPSASRHALLFVLGRYSASLECDPTSLVGFLAALDAVELTDRTDWMVCAFGRGETAALTAALALGGHARVGFENSLVHADGSTAIDNADRVGGIADMVTALCRGRASRSQTAAMLGAATVSAG
ncbi:uncharacterized protein (DUF849 family) [Rhodobium orientis]|uniref:Class III aminotransferase n=1 Tax=Rhodobium orientis TaxID=34017 RepID=A0A327JGB2_9HYPH|nr:3-keto-5-aminohexanoate cleavage protein [Rhodobium orientis]MBB4301483.1 uncharacterized protein (DUF849 family) [Rhodobium orientis]MBK5952180.1 hypothetical protein [Rhodobium orientis]RAI25447.1 hypothetical protein CH339_18135 [Rhodobium orientis]